MINGLLIATVKAAFHSYVNNLCFVVNLVLSLGVPLYILYSIDNFSALVFFSIFNAYEGVTKRGGRFHKKSTYVFSLFLAFAEQSGI